MTLNPWKISTLAFATAFVASVGVGAVCAADAKQPHMTDAKASLEAAKTQLDIAKHDKDGHRVKAIALVKDALKEVDLGITAGEDK
ncbi:MAG: hypothetical protein ACHREM_19360 [Polyangiales bacterium]